MSDISPVVLSYLKTLSHEELIALIHSFANAHEDIRFTLEEKSGMENAKNKNETVAAYGLQIAIRFPVFCIRFMFFIKISLIF